MSTPSLKDFVLIDTTAALTDIMPILEQAPRVVVDLEGLDLGNIGGCLSIIIIRPIIVEPATTYIIDAVTLDRNALQPVFNLIEADSPVKVVYDGRMDYAEFSSTFGVKMGVTLDMQIADVTSRAARGQTLTEQMRRLPMWLKGAAMSSPAFYQDMQNINSLVFCMKEHGIAKAVKSKVDHSQWLTRPISEEYQKYAADDARLIELLYVKLVERGFVTEGLAETTHRYLTVWGGERTAGDDKFKQHALLPLNIIDYTPPNPGRTCSKCGRLLPFSCYGKGAQSCKLCHVLRLMPFRRR